MSQVRESSVAVIIPCYRDAATLGRALDSVRAQTRLPGEVIVVNDCSPETEAVERVLVAYPEVRYVKNPVNVGLAEARNVGVRATECEIVTFLDADDELHPQKIAFQLSAYRAGVAVTCGVARIGGDEVGLACATTYPTTFPLATVTDSRAILRRNTLTGAAMMIGRETFLELGGYDAALRSCEDFDFWLRLLDAGVPALKVELPLYLYRVNAAGLSRNYPAISHWELEALSRYFRRHDPAFPSRPDDARTWACWMLKHLLRCERCGDPALRAATRGNIARLQGFPLLRIGLGAVDRLRLLKPLAWMMEVAG